ncbi:centromere protein F isoform X2 [Chrysemys picta bellii]|uniref:centromere protein F isoform X2 n=1 Tax=Chrysemys picta bellii TaxID=8478 RepID=UPI0032B1DA29
MKKEKNLLCCQSEQKITKNPSARRTKNSPTLSKGDQNYAEEMKNKSLSQKIELEAQEAELQHLKTNNKLLQDSVQELQLENGTLKNMNKALEEEKVDKLKYIDRLKKQNRFARSETKTWMKSCADEVANSLHENEPEYETDGFPEVVKKVKFVMTDKHTERLQAKVRNIKLYGSSFHCLKLRSWISDEVIDAYLSCVVEKADGKVQAISSVVSTFILSDRAPQMKVKKLHQTIN